MQIKVAGHSGFCFGVKRAINIAEKTLAGSSRKNSNFYSLGPLIHNPQVVDDLSQRGLRVIDKIDGLMNGTVIVSSHGAAKDVIRRIKRKKIKLVDATCPFVKYAQDIVRKLKKEGYHIIIIGDKEHPEVKALMSLSGNTERGAKSKKIAIISQTTQSKENYILNILEIMKDDFSEIRIFNTICNDTSRRQELARGLLKECDVMIIVGGKNSANTKRLCEICKVSGVDSYHIEVPSELKEDYFAGKKCAGIVSGASTPDSIVRSVLHKIKELTKGAY